MRKLLLCLIVLLTINAFAQKTKSITVFSNPSYKFSIRGVISYNDQNLPSDTSYYISAMDEQYTMIYEPIILKSGSLPELYNFLKELHLAICNEDVGVSLNVDRCRVSITKIFGIRTGIITNPNGNSQSFCSIDYGKLSGVINKLKGYCEKNKIQLK